MKELKVIYIIFGVSGSGKTTIGKAFAENLGIPFYDADDFHPEANLKKMSDGMPLNDNDRNPWLQELAKEIEKWHNKSGAVLACSALKQKYRKVLQSVDAEYIKWIFLEGSYELIYERMASRDKHFFKKELLNSQFQTLEKPKEGIIVNIDKNITEIITEIKSKLNTLKSQIGLIGLGVMGKSLAKNLLSKNFHLSVYNRQVEDKEVDVAQKFVEQQSTSNIVLGFDELERFVESLEQPRVILVMVSAGKPLDMVIREITPLLSSGDCLIDGGNSNYKDTSEREKNLLKSGVHFIGAGISGGEEGALKGPSIMPGGSKDAYIKIRNFLEAIAAKDKTGRPCCNYIGPEGSGHYVKMVHNGIEYAEMQLLAETYHFLRFYVKKTPAQISEILESWRKKGKDSYLLEITINILKKKEGNCYLIDKILDKSRQKGTGGWSTISALDLGVPLSTISEAVMVRNLSGMKSNRVAASELYSHISSINIYNEKELIANLESAFYATSIINHHIGFNLIQKASQQYNWNLNLSEIARIWTNGCIIRSELMEKISILFLSKNNTSLLLFPEIVDILKAHFSSLTEVVSTAFKAGCPLPVASAAINYFLTYSSAQSSANMIQAQRDYFGAHTYQRIDRSEDEYFHSNWKNE
ncbi:NADP-dependent phosphogluconate dehydrogenase [Aquimarina sp. 2201CG5-10]|uniref:NADP-dependent phosphogluconate dehydrogenase n=1 Tax=Aquimarina callyspongiae TaxID=3098150 RepID=UPI002AB59588|nr:NADP-dependent phosphogluconate dehydrogenase [Aquimarina sp. 2201CG5-10]MDY8135785.1 NADP-dependent phosphogluconate dehydrogenase [Aquimarina sp. 2201CG5-10]